MTESIGEKILNKIKTEHILPRPKWQYQLRSYLLWVSGIIALLVGAAAFSVIIHILIFSDWDLYRYIDKNIMTFTLLTLPYYWIIFLFIFALIIHYNFRHTKGGYKYPMSIVMIAIILLSMFFGALLYLLGVGKQIDYVLKDNMPVYSRFINKRPLLWMEPKSGRIAGFITEIGPEEMFKLKDFGGREWLIFYHDAKIHPMADININNRVRIIGDEDDDQEDGYFIFNAKLIFPAMHLGPNFKGDMSRPGSCPDHNFPLRNDCPIF